MVGNSQNDVQDVVRLLSLLLCGSLFFALSGERVRWGFVHYVEDIEKNKGIQLMQGNFGKVSPINW